MECFDFITPEDDDLKYGTGTDGYETSLYQYAFLPNDPTGTNHDTVTSYANVYRMAEDSVVRSVSTQTFSFGTKTRFDLYLLDEGATTPTDGKLVWSHDEDFTYGGYHRVELDTPVLVEEGDALGIVCTAELPNGTYEVVNNQSAGKELADCQTAHATGLKWAEAVVNPGESFVGSPSKKITYSDGSYDYDGYAWTDFSSVIDEGSQKAQALLDEVGLDALVKTRDDAYDVMDAIMQEDDPTADPNYETAMAAYQTAQMQLYAAVQQLLTMDGARYAFYAQDNFPLKITTETYDVENPPTAGSVEMLRLYNPATGEHLYTKDANEKSVLTGIGWNDEGTGWISPASSNVPVYRLHNPVTGEHLYTTSTVERDALLAGDWVSEGTGFHSDPERSIPVFRLFNPSQPSVASHHYTKDVYERDTLIRRGWRFEGIAWYSQES